MLSFFFRPRSSPPGFGSQSRSDRRSRLDILESSMNGISRPSTRNSYLSSIMSHLVFVRLVDIDNAFCDQYARHTAGVFYLYSTYCPFVLVSPLPAARRVALHDMPATSPDPLRIRCILSNTSTQVVIPEPIVSCYHSSSQISPCSTP